MADHSGNSEERVPSPVDRWEELLESVTSDVSQIANDVSRIRGVVVAAWWLWWILFTACAVAYLVA